MPLHRWFDLSEHGFGCAILSESKYGGSTFASTMRLSLLRCTAEPRSNLRSRATQLRLGLMPHANGWRDAGVVAESMRFNAPLRRVANASAEPFVICDHANLIVDTIKRAEDSDATIVRLYECHGARGTAHLTFNTRFAKATWCDILEQPTGQSLHIDASRSIPIAYEPYKIISLLLE